MSIKTAVCVFLTDRFAQLTSLTTMLSQKAIPDRTGNANGPLFLTTDKRARLSQKAITDRKRKRTANEPQTDRYFSKVGLQSRDRWTAVFGKFSAAGSVSCISCILFWYIYRGLSCVWGWSRNKLNVNMRLCCFTNVIYLLGVIQVFCNRGNKLIVCNVQNLPQFYGAGTREQFFHLNVTTNGATNMADRYVRSVRTRYRNTLHKEVQSSRLILRDLSAERDEDEDFDK